MRYPTDIEPTTFASHPVTRQPLHQASPQFTSQQQSDSVKRSASLFTCTGRVHRVHNPTQPQEYKQGGWTRYLAADSVPSGRSTAQALIGQWWQHEPVWSHIDVDIRFDFVPVFGSSAD
jgi:hypothetical protein